jgi:hypothetical protein
MRTSEIARGVGDVLVAGPASAAACGHDITMTDPEAATMPWRRPGALQPRGGRRQAIVAAAIGAAMAIQWLGRASGSTRAERRQRLPGDELVDHPTVVANHATTIPAPPGQVWPWLVQVGWHRGGWYTPRWVDRLLFPGNWPSATQPVPELQRPLQVGDHIPDGPPDTAWFLVERVGPPRLLVLHATTHLPATWRVRLGASIDWSWTFTLADTAGGGTRLLLRVNGRTRPWWLTALTSPEKPTGGESWPF